MSSKTYLSTLIVVSSFCFSTTVKLMAEMESQSPWKDLSTSVLPSDNGPVPVIVRRLNFTWRRSTDQYLEHHDIVAVIVPSINIYWLGESSDQQLYEKRTVDRRFFVLGNSIVGVSANRGDVLKFFVSALKLTTTDASQEINSIVHQKIDQFERTKFDLNAVHFGMENVLGSFPFTGHPDARGEPAPNITNIRVNSDGFTIEMTGGSNNAVSASITFDMTFKPLKATLNSVQVYPK